MPRKSRADKAEKYEEKYYVISKVNIYQLSRHVRRMINEGATPVGGMVIDDSPSGRRYIQTMVFE